ncbi:hypothetical protein B586_20075 [Mycobacterium haemophilum DSM 44634]|uniref:Uncharacterized protein n=1 Tax=Mycobacterium haemophilum TaxID=29311 RepID=A0A0I9UPF6_9MYCO|nr:hypothetical protein B586_20075 [Mycobacterium haemophilum DSM 44634]KLO32790.1 hypothetical protein ABH39_04445 [Mycobacterium haemophilum]KLO37092.1 hypothetical protein ABH38_09285 [Mycobacterium haemophilum]KLO43565.1 hypothetical protein ABH37_06810 [Mycobacterium haemophilum]KLO55923.1 hypothetical protein ABH36_03960 [Mycobacterium haemophilum]
MEKSGGRTENFLAAGPRACDPLYSKLYSKSCAKLTDVTAYRFALGLVGTCYAGAFGSAAQRIRHDYHGR